MERTELLKAWITQLKMVMMMMMVMMVMVMMVMMVITTTEDINHVFQAPAIY